MADDFSTQEVDASALTVAGLRELERESQISGWGEKGGRAGIDLRTLQELAGHSTPDLTARYSHRRLHDLTGAVEKLANFLPTNEGEAEEAFLSLTGTSGGAGFSCTPVAHGADSDCGRPMMADDGDGGAGGDPSTHKPLDFPGVCGPLRAGDG